MGQSSSKKDFKLDDSKTMMTGQAGSIKKRIEMDSVIPSGISKSSLRTPVRTIPVVKEVIADNSVAMTTNQPQAQSNNEVVSVCISYCFSLLLYLSYHISLLFYFISVRVLLVPTRIIPL